MARAAVLPATPRRADEAAHDLVGLNMRVNGTGYDHWIFVNL